MRYPEFYRMTHVFFYEGIRVWSLVWFAWLIGQMPPALPLWRHRSYCCRRESNGGIQNQTCGTTSHHTIEKHTRKTYRAGRVVASPFSVGVYRGMRHVQRGLAWNSCGCGKFSLYETNLTFTEYLCEGIHFWHLESAFSCFLTRKSANKKGFFPCGISEN